MMFIAIGIIALACIIINLIIALIAGNSSGNTVSSSLVSLRDTVNYICLGAIVLIVIAGFFLRKGNRRFRFW
jgi:hypothetical protein